MRTTKTKTELLQQCLPMLWNAAYQQRHHFGPDEHEGLRESFQEAGLVFALAAKRWNPSHESRARFSTLLYKHLRMNHPHNGDAVNTVPINEHDHTDPRMPDPERRTLLHVRLNKMSTSAREMSSLALSADHGNPSIKRLAQEMRTRGHSWKVIHAARREIKELLEGF